MVLQKKKKSEIYDFVQIIVFKGGRGVLVGFGSFFFNLFKFVLFLHPGNWKSQNFEFSI